MKTTGNFKKVSVIFILITAAVILPLTVTGCSGSTTVNVDMERV